MNMKKVVISGLRQVELVEVAAPRPKENWALVKVMVTPMCTEYKMYVGGYPNQYLGHEAVGEVVEVAQAGLVKPGDRVVVQPLYSCGRCRFCRTGDYIHCEHLVNLAEFTGAAEGGATYAQYLLKPDWLLSPIPDCVSYEQAALALCGLGPTFGAMQTMGVNAFDTVLITGLGPVGLGGVVNARFRGARVIGVECFPWRVERAMQLGADVVLDPGDPDLRMKIKALTEGAGVDCAVDCSGTVTAQRLCIDAARRKGKVAFVGECSDDLDIRISPDMIRKGLTLIGSWHYPLRDFYPIMQVIQGSPVIDRLTSHMLPMSAVEEAFKLQEKGECAKVLLHPWE
jgi:threonine dehydrogenase-like Zn-dependent dehydrogenase